MAEQNNTITDAEEVRLPPVNMRKFRIMSIWFVRFFFVLLFSFFVLSLIIPLRPKYSESEKRELTKFPKFTLTALVSGDYFDGINSWYSDTFPLREKLTDINAFFSAFYGKTDVQIQGDVKKGDDIPESHPGRHLRCIIRCVICGVKRAIKARELVLLGGIIRAAEAANTRADSGRHRHSVHCL